MDPSFVQPWFFFHYAASCFFFFFFFFSISNFGRFPPLSVQMIPPPLSPQSSFFPSQRGFLSPLKFPPYLWSFSFPVSFSLTPILKFHLFFHVSAFPNPIRNRKTIHTSPTPFFPPLRPIFPIQSGFPLIPVAIVLSGIDDTKPPPPLFLSRGSNGFFSFFSFSLTLRCPLFFFFWLEGFPLKGLFPHFLDALIPSPSGWQGSIELFDQPHLFF